MVEGAQFGLRIALPGNDDEAALEQIALQLHKDLTDSNAATVEFTKRPAEPGAKAPEWLEVSYMVLTSVVDAYAIAQIIKSLRQRGVKVTAENRASGESKDLSDVPENDVVGFFNHTHV